MDNLTFGIKYTPFRSREGGLCRLVASIRVRYPQPLLVASNGQALPLCCALQAARHVRSALGLSAGRNALARATTTEFLMVLDDDVLFTDQTDVQRLVSHVATRGVHVAAACYSGIPPTSWAFKFGNECAAGWFRTAETMPDRAILYTPTGVNAMHKYKGLERAHVVQNAFVARAHWLRQHRWDARLQTAEDTLWFYQRHKQKDSIAFDKEVQVEHSGNKSQTGDYNRRSTRYQEAHFLQWMCKAEPTIKFWLLPFWSLDCRTRMLKRRFPVGYAPKNVWAQQQMLPQALTWTKELCEPNPFAVRKKGVQVCGASH